MFKSWVCKTLKVFTLIWQKQAGANAAKSENVGVKERPAIAQKPDVADSIDTHGEESAESSFVRDEKGRLCFRSNEEDEVREVAHKLVGIGFSQKGAIEIMCKKKLAGCKNLFDDLAYLEAQGQIIENKVGWFLEMAATRSRS